MHYRFFWSILLLLIAFPPLTYCQNDFGEELAFSTNEIHPAFYFNGHIGRYIFQGPYFNLTVLLRDHYNDQKLNGSIMGVATLAPAFAFAIMAGAASHRDTVKTTAQEIASKVMAGYLGAVALINSQHHFIVAESQSHLFGWTPQLSAFCGTRSDWFAFQDRSWFRIAPCAGIQLLLKEPPKSNAGSAKSMGIELGFARPYDFVEGTTMHPGWQIFLGIKDIGM